MKHLLTSAEIMFSVNKFLEMVRASPDGGEVRYIMAVVLKYPDETKQKSKLLPFFPESEIKDVTQFTKKR